MFQQRFLGNLSGNKNHREEVFLLFKLQNCVT